ncbi:RNA polymerase sigma factor [Streptomyces flavidovirens]|uniref:RNA polymerase sigma factor n=1 Tax=Streptomyces flavidovirens TaxID=67298 RepID=UPI0033B3A8CA
MPVNQHDTVPSAASAAEGLGMFGPVLLKAWPSLMHYLLANGLKAQDAEDVLSEAAMRFLNVSHHRQLENPRAYLWKVVHHALIDHYRAVSRRREVLDDVDLEPLLGTERSAEEVVAGNSVDNELLLMVRSLSPKQQEVITLMYLQGLSAKETARLMGTTAATVRTQRRLAIKRLQGMYDRSTAANETAGTSRPVPSAGS